MGNLRFSPFPPIRLTAERTSSVCLNAAVVDLQHALSFSVSENQSRHLAEVPTLRREPRVLAALSLKSGWQEI